MSVPNYYRDGVSASAQMKADLKRVRQARPHRYVTRKMIEQRHDAEGGAVAITVNREPDAVFMSPRQRHELWTRRAK